MKSVSVLLLFLSWGTYAETVSPSVRSPSCEAELNVVNPNLSLEARAYLGLVRLGVREGDIQPEDLIWLESQNQIANPLREGKNLRTSSLSIGIERVRSGVRASEWDAIKSELRDLREKVSVQAERIEIARDAAAPIYKLRPLDLEHRAVTEHFKVFKSRQNEIFYFAVNPDETFVAKLHSSWFYKLEDAPFNEEMVDFFEGRDGKVYFAWEGRKQIYILNLQSGEIIFQKSISSDETLLDARALGVTVGPLVFEVPDGLRIALVAPPGAPAGEREKGLVIFDHQGDKLRTGTLPVGQAQVSRLEDGNLYAYGIGTMGASDNKVNLYLNEVGQGLSGIEAWTPKAPLESFEGHVPRVYLRDGKPQMIILPRKLAPPLMYNQRTSRLNAMPGVERAFHNVFKFFTSELGKPSFVALERPSGDSTEPPILKTGEIGSLLSVREHRYKRVSSRGALSLSEVIESPSGLLVVLWEMLDSRLMAVNVMHLNSGHITHMSIPESLRFQQVSKPFYDPKSDRLMVMFKNAMTSQWELFQLYGKPN